MTDQPFPKILADFRAEMESWAVAVPCRLPDFTTFHALNDELGSFARESSEANAIRKKLNAMLVLMDYARRLPSKRPLPAPWTDIDETNWEDHVEVIRKWWANDRR